MRWKKEEKKKKKKKEKKNTITYSLNRLFSNWLKFQFDQRKKISRPERVKVFKIIFETI